MGQRPLVLADPSGTDALHGIAGFASLHVSVVATALFFAIRAGMATSVRAAAWLYLLLTALATIYFGWHYLLDDVAGLVIAWVSVVIGAWATGQGVPPTELIAAEEELGGSPVKAESGSTPQPDAVTSRQAGSRTDSPAPVALTVGESPTVRPLD